MAARKTKFTPRNLRKILDALKVGAPMGTAIGVAGVHFSTWEEWTSEGRTLADALAKGDLLEEPCVAFAAWMAEHAEALEPPPPPEFSRAALAVAVAKAQEEAVAGYVAAVRRGAAQDWRAAAWWLERRRSAEFGGAQRVEISGPNGAPLLKVTQDLLDMTPEQLRALRDGPRAIDQISASGDDPDPEGHP